MVPFGPWRPDEAVVGVPVTANVNNVVPLSVIGDGQMLYGPAPSFVAEVDGPAERVLGARGFIFPDGTVSAFIGTATKLYRVNQTAGTLEDVSGTTYTATPTAKWDFEVYGVNVIATNKNDGPQRFIEGTDSAFSDLSGDALHGSVAAVWKDQLAIGAVGANSEGVQWSEINDITDWTGTNSDTQLFPGFGKVTGISRGNTPLVIQERGIQRGTFTGTSEVFAFDTLTQDFGCRVTQGVVFRRDVAYFYSDEGFKAIAATGDIAHIGHRKIDNWIRDRLQTSADTNFAAFADPKEPIVGWTAKLDATSAAPIDTLLLYNIVLGEWTRVSVNMEWVVEWRPQGLGLDDLDTIGTLDALPASLDSVAWEAGFPRIGGLNADRAVGLFNGASLAATIETPEFGERRRSRVASVRPVVDGASTVTHYGRESRVSGWTASSPINPFARTQAAKINRAARFHKLALSVPAGTDWSGASGLDVTTRPASM